MQKKYFLIIALLFTIANSAGTDYGINTIRRYSAYSHIMNTPLYFAKDGSMQPQKSSEKNKNHGLWGKKFSKKRTMKHS